MTADANILIHRARLGAQDHLQMFEEPIPVEELINSICNVKHAYTQYGGLRPFGVSFLFAGWDRYNGFQLYASDPSGNYGAWKASAIGANHQTAQNVLKENWTEDLDIGGAIRLTVKVLSKTMDSTSLTSEKRTLICVDSIIVDSPHVFVFVSYDDGNDVHVYVIVCLNSGIRYSYTERWEDSVPRPHQGRSDRCAQTS
jgi:20S proteasome alpha/beta subunit